LNFSASSVSYEATGYFSKIVLDYIAGAPTVRPFYTHEPTVEGIEKAIAERSFTCNRSLLVSELEKQYESVGLSGKVRENIASLLHPDTYTICTAHQPNIFTGHLYFIYKILHAIKLAHHLNEALPKYHFVPVYYMGSEDADLAELGEVTVDGTTYHWQTAQKGAVGRMLVDDALIKIMSAIAGQLLVLPYGEAIITLVKKCYVKGTRIEQATFMLIHELFAAYGLVVLLPDNARLKEAMQPVFTEELLNNAAAAIVAATSALIEKNYKVQAQPRDINLFYLLDDIRERIEWKEEEYQVLNTEISFTKAEMLAELQQHPERFSPNVILRGLYQETILPNVAFIGGGGELAYWLQLKDLFTHFKVPYPVQVLRNSFLLIEAKIAHKIEQVKFTHTDLFDSATLLMNRLVKKESTAQLELTAEKETLINYYQLLKIRAGNIDETLQQHVEAIGEKALQKVIALEKKMLRAEKRRFETEERHIRHIKDVLFPGDNLQERVDNFMAFYARYGQYFIHELYSCSPANEPLLTILTEKEKK
jgi:bacillithiol synthase